ncbi:hypothetical protein J0A78_02190 [Providencia rettgeri]|uniref:hypothetical protein n=1 Tax=Providencia rettgeri TaxID=587 RepID=UPI0019D4308F|nr:hypothetical protein [Providencia rettgeri]MBN7843650.1 hypothetical protein [Providencia rettgeri]MBN7852747.1 hypothetical protein [Providencia rettgeri]MBN7861544.1 hypothetical protein [Providencia rettgeri]MBN7871595.1 hypothetical protein [Providencia rettgeri]MBN7896827.1 hypothetical protein [Providencia rettgeri]
MRMTQRKKEIMNLFAADNLEWVTSEIGAPPFDVAGVAYILNGMDSFNKKSIVESARRTLDSMVSDGLLEKVSSYERRQNRTQGSGDSPGVRCVVSRYGLPGQCNLVKYEDNGEDFIEGECVRVS